MPHERRHPVRAPRRAFVEGLLDPKLDVVFKMLLTQSPALLCALLTAVLEPLEPFEEVQLLNPELSRERVQNKNSILDIRALLPGKLQAHVYPSPPGVLVPSHSAMAARPRKANVEMQGKARAGLLQRFLYYWARDYVGQLGAGQSYSDLAVTSSVFILNFCLLPTRRYHSVFRLQEIHGHHELLEDLDLHFLELPRLPRGRATTTEPPAVKWGRFLTARTASELEELSMNDPILGQAKEELERLSADPVAQRLARDRERDEIAHKFTLHRTREEGRVQGKAEGERELLRKLLVLKFGTLPKAAEARLARAEAPELSRWAERLLTATSLHEALD